MDTQLFKQLVSSVESETLDFKLVHHDLNLENLSDDDKNKKVAEFLKDVTAFINTPREETSHIIYGIGEDKKNGRALVFKGVSSEGFSVDIVEEQFSKLNFKPKYNYEEISHEGNLYGILSFPVCPYNEFCTIKETVGSFEKGQVYIRNGSKKTIATPDQIIRISEWYEELEKKTETSAENTKLVFNQNAEEISNFTGNIEELNLNN